MSLSTSYFLQKSLFPSFFLRVILCFGILFSLSHCTPPDGKLCKVDQDCFYPKKKCVGGECKRCLQDSDCDSGQKCTGTFTCIAGNQSSTESKVEAIAEKKIARNEVLQPGEMVSKEANDASEEYATEDPIEDKPSIETSQPVCKSGETKPCYSGSNGCVSDGKGSYSCKGLCRTGLEVCVAGAWSGKCVGTAGPAKEVCNGKDDDCNGKTDDHPDCKCKPGDKQKCYDGAKGTEGQGLCKAGEQYCTNKYQWGSCLGQIQPATESCDGKDNDCDGTIDNGFAALGKNCEVGKGVCKAQGKYVCKQDGTGTECNAKKGVPIAEICGDGKDNDCDGSIDEIDANCKCKVGATQKCYSGSPTTEGKGICKAGIQTCKADQTWEKACKGEVRPATESCDGKDNDCDGTPDNIADLGKPCIDKARKGICQAGKWACEKNKKVCKATLQPVTEVCDGKDNNCDGTPDNIVELGRPCKELARKGECQTGVWVCVNNKKNCKQTVQRTTEICDGKDNDCNGQVDDQIKQVGQSCKVSGKVGPCSRSVYSCSGGQLKCLQTVQRTTEICDGKDNDCNGSVDNGVCSTTAARILINSSYDDRGTGIAVDRQGVYLVGWLHVPNPTKQTLYRQVMFVSKYNFAGVQQWRRELNVESEGFDIAVDRNGNIYATGFFKGSTTFGNSAISSAGGRDILVVKIANSGSILWAKSAGGNASRSDVGISIAVDSARSYVYVVGIFSGTARFGSTQLIAKGSTDGFVAKLRSNGTFLWAKSIGGSGAESSVQSVALDNFGNVFAVGSFANTVTFGSLSMKAKGSQDSFVTRLTPAGAFIWVKTFGPSTTSKGVICDTGSNIYVTGSFSQTIALGSSTLRSQGSSDVYVAKLNSSGSILWGNSTGGTSTERSTGIGIDSKNDIYVIGEQFSSTMSYRSITPIPTPAVIKGPSIFLFKINSSGKFIWGRTGGSSNYASGEGVAVINGSFYATGAAVRANQFQSINIPLISADGNDPRPHTLFWKGN